MKIEAVTSYSCLLFYIHIAETELPGRMTYSHMSPYDSRRSKAGTRERDSQFTALSYTLPDGSNDRSIKLGTQSPTYTDENKRGTVCAGGNGTISLLMFHGVILRSQLIELIKNKVFFSEGARVNVSVFLYEQLATCTSLLL